MKDKSKDNQDKVSYIPQIGIAREQVSQLVSHGVSGGSCQLPNLNISIRISYWPPSTGLLSEIFTKGLGGDINKCFTYSVRQLKPVPNSKIMDSKHSWFIFS